MQLGKGLLAGALVATFALLLLAPARVNSFTLIGEDITVTLEDPTNLIVAVNDPVLVQDPAIEITPGDGSQIGSLMLPNELIDIQDTLIVITLEEGLPGGSTGFGAGSSYAFTDIGLGATPLTVQDVQITSLINISGVALGSEVLFDAHSVTLFIDTLLIGEIPGVDVGTVTLGLTLTPEPATASQIGLGLAGLALAWSEAPDRPRGISLLEKLTLESFAPCLDQTFRIRLESATLDLELISADSLCAAASGGRAPFSLVFRGPREPLLPQRSYHLEHQSLGELELFLVPLGPDEQGLRYEAVFG